ncbi:energy transducer TonB [Hymenobacter sp. J193]|uniref:energy transducer TonB n=1 Tax=Hymenobacter sp. J193 TaxID=2898429 RepID=UPI002150E58F|nr:energy transducer TonB [Hymenobacter sp. J193]MCR5886384.1 energy transducer TonB [Hymenobacter sp. J193]
MKKIYCALALGFLATVPALAQQGTPVAPAPATTAPAPAQAGPAGIVAAAKYYEGGPEAMYAFINQELKYPVMARRNRIQGTCIVSFTLNTDGTMSGVKLVKQVGGGCGEEALRLVRLLKFNKPDYAILTNLPIAFKLPAPGQAAAQ